MKLTGENIEEFLELLEVNLIKDLAPLEEYTVDEFVEFIEINGMDIEIETAKAGKHALDTWLTIWTDKERYTLAARD